MRIVSISTLILILTPLSINAATIDSLWIDSIPAHRALCASGTSADPLVLKNVAREFHEKLNGLTSAGNLYFDAIAVDEAAHTVTWRACAPAPAGAPVPAGFESIEVSPQRAVFAVCADGEEAADCTNAVITRLFDRVDPSNRTAIAELRPRGARIAAVPMPIDNEGRAAVGRLLVDPTAIALHPAHDAEANRAAPLKDATVTRRPLAAPPASAALQTDSLPETTMFVVAIPLPAEPSIANGIAAAVQ